MDTTSITKPIILFSARYLPSVGGVEFFTENLGNRLAALGHTVTIVTTEQDDGTGHDARRQVGNGTLEVVRLDSWGPKRMRFVKKSRRNRELIARLEHAKPFHALINTRFYSLSRLAARLCSNSHIRPVLIEHGTGYISFGEAIPPFFAQFAEHVTAALLKRYPIDFYGISKDASRWLSTFGITSCGEIHNALDTSAFVSCSSNRDFRKEFGVASDTLCVAFAARLVVEKGTNELLDAARALKDDPRIHFLVAGAGPLEDEVVQASESLPNLDYVGMLDHADLASLLLDSDVFCLPSYSEGLPTSILEAAACSCAVVVTHVGGVDEMIPTGEYGIVLEQAQPADLIRAFTALAEDPQKLAALKAAIHRYVEEHFSWENTIRELLAAFSK